MAKAGFSLVGLDIGSSGIRAVELTTSRRQQQPEIARAAWLDLPPGVLSEGTVLDPQALTNSIKKVWREGRFKSRRVAFAVPAAKVLTRQLDLPWMNSQEFRSALRYQVQGALPMDIDSVQLDYHLLEERTTVDAKGYAYEENRILVVAAERLQTSALALAIRDAQLEPVIADHAPFALIRSLCQGKLPEDSQARAIIDIGAQQLTVIVHAHGQPLFIRVLSPAGGHQATEAIAQELGIEFDQAELLKCSTDLNAPVPILVPVAESSVFSSAYDIGLPEQQTQDSGVIAAVNTWASFIVTEIRNSLDYYNSGEHSLPIIDLTCVGRAASMPGLIERIGTQLPYPIVRTDPWMGFPGGERRKHQPASAQLALAIGLATAKRP